MVRKKLAFGSKERLLLSFRGGCILPLSNDLHACAIRFLKFDDDEVAKQALLHQVTPSEILLPVDRNAAGVLILREFKTQDRNHPVLYTRSLGHELTKEQRASLEQDPRLCITFTVNVYTPVLRFSLLNNLTDFIVTSITADCATVPFRVLQGS